MAEVRHRLHSAGVYLRFNLWSLVPGIAALLVLVVLRQTLFLAEICPSAGNLNGNPLFCTDGRVIASMLDHVLADIRNSLAPPTDAQAPQTRLLAATRAEEEANDAKTVADAAVTQARAELDVPGADQAAAQAALKTAVAQQAAAGSAAAQRHREHSTRASIAKQTSQAHAALFREARARLRWIGSYGAVVAFAIGTILAAFCIWGMAIDDHLNPETGDDTPHRKRQKGLAGLAVLLGVSLVALLFVWTASFTLLKATVFRGMGLPGPFSLDLLHFDDAVTTFIFGQLTDVGGSFFPGGIALVSGASLMVTIAVVVLGAAVGATLYQTPWQVQAWRASLKAAPPAVPVPGPYERFLKRCFQRLNTCIYIGATLMVICVVHLNAQYSWVSALLDPSAESEPWKTALPNAITGFADEVSFQYGLAFSTVLVGLFLPTWVILRRRAWAVARAQCPADGTNAGVQKWLESHGMGFTNVQQYSQVLALLAPAGAGVFVSILKVFTGGNS